MKLRIYLFKLSVAVIAFALGCGFYNIFQIETQRIAANQINPSQELSVPQPVSKPEPVVVHTTASSNSIDSDHESEWQFEPDGSFFSMDELPRAFKDFEYIDITTRDYLKTSKENAYGVPIPPEGFLQTANKRYNFTRINISNKLLSFETETKQGISYRFTGKYYYNTVSLKGRLIKMKNRRKISERVFHLEIGGC